MNFMCVFMFYIVHCVTELEGEAVLLFFYVCVLTLEGECDIMRRICVFFAVDSCEKM